MSCCCTPASRFIASRSWSAARRAATLLCSSTARRISSSAWRSRLNAWRALAALLATLRRAASLLAAVARQLLDLLLQLIGLAAEHLLLPALLGRLFGVGVALRGKLALPARQLIQLAQRVLDLRAALAGVERGLHGLVLILLGVELQVEQARQIAPRRVDRAAAAPGTESDLDLPERRLRAQQVLEGLLLLGDGG